jgi:lipopolysaccharide transport system permease protein
MKIIIEPGRTEKNYWKDLWHYKELFYILAWRDVKVRYKQTVIGVLWSIIRPLLTMIVFTVVFSKIANLPSEGTAPYAILVYAAMLPWQFFSTALPNAVTVWLLIQILYRRFIFHDLLFLQVLSFRVLLISLFLL